MEKRFKTERCDENQALDLLEKSEVNVNEARHYWSQDDQDEGERACGHRTYSEAWNMRKRKGVQARHGLISVDVLYPRAAGRSTYLGGKIFGQA